MFKGFLHFFGIEIFRVKLDNFYEIEEEIKHMQASASTDIQLFVNEAFAQNIMDTLKTLANQSRKQAIEYLNPELKKTGEDILKLVESSVIPFLKAHIGVKDIHKTSQEHLEKDLTIILDLYDKFRDEWDEFY